MNAVSAPLLRRPWFIGLILAAALGALTLLFYSNSFDAAFLLDNKIVLLRDPRLSAWNSINLHHIFSENYWWPNFPSDLYRPLTTLSYLINHAILLNGVNPKGYHVVNFLLHWADAVLLLALLRRISGSVKLAIIAAVIFAVHPIAVESVTNIVGRADLLATFFVLLGAHCHVRACSSGNWKEKTGWQVGLFFSSVLGVLCKESAIVILGFVLLFDFLYRWPNWGATVRERASQIRKASIWTDYLVLVPMLLIFAVARRKISYESVVQWQYFIDNPIARAEPFQGVMTALRVQGQYLLLLLFPAYLTCDYSYDHVPLYGTASGLQDIGAWAAFGAIAILLLTAWKYRHDRREYAFGVFLYFGLMFPTANLVKVIGSIMAERFVYLPSVGFALIAALALDITGRWVESVFGKLFTRFVYYAPIAIITLLLGFRTYLRNDDWRTELKLWVSAVEVAPDSFKTHKGYAEAIFNSNPTEKGVDAAIAEGEKGVAILNHPEVDRHIERRDVTLFIDMGRYYGIKANFARERNDTATAKANYEKAVEILRRAAEVDVWVNEESHRGQVARGKRLEELHQVGRADVHQNLAVVYFQLDRLPEAIASAQMMQRLAPFDPNPALLTASCLLRQNRLEEAAVENLIALVIDPNNTTGWNALHDAYAKMDAAHNPAVPTDGGKYTLNINSPVARRDLNSACLWYYNFLIDSHYYVEADHFRGFATNTYKCPPELLGIKAAGSNLPAAGRN